MTQTTRTRTKKQTKRKPNYSKRARRLQREMMLSVILIVLAIFLMIKFHSSPTLFELVIFQEDAQVEEVQYYSSFKTAKREMQKLIEQGEFNPAVLDEAGNILAIRYGVVNFRTKTCGENTSYEVELTGRSGYTNGCYGADGAYLETNDQATQVRFKQSGVVGWVAMSEIQILNYYDSAKLASVNHYTLKDGNIIHQGTTDTTKPDYAISNNIGKNDKSLTGEHLFSYDGHYFYSEYPSMIDDYRANTYEHSLNPDTPHYNYFQFLSHRAKTSYISKELNWYISNYLGYTAKPTTYPAGDYESQLYNEGSSFITAQNTYGVNALMMLSLAINESGFGKSQIAIEKNNLFGHAAYDNAPNESANGYKDVAASIDTHASIFLNQGYLNPCDQAEPDSSPSPSTCLTLEGNRYMGGYFGDKESGLNVNYASDPYWGEKAAQYYRSVDELLGGNDESRFDIKVLRNKGKTAAYAMPNTSFKVIFYTPMVEHYAVIVVGEVEGEEVNGNTKWYKVQSDGVLNTARNALVVSPDNYIHKNDIVYIPAAYFE